MTAIDFNEFKQTVKVMDSINCHCVMDINFPSVFSLTKKGQESLEYD